MVPVENVKRVGVVGAGVIGSGWVVHFLRVGLDVCVYDPAPAARDRVKATVEGHWPIAAELGLHDGASPDRLDVVARLEDLVDGTDVVQEATPEVLDAKIETFGRLDALAAADTALFTSTSGLSVSAIQSGCARHPERMAAGHPFNPPYLIPLVEVVGGALTDPRTIDWAMDFYAGIDKRPMRLDREVPAFIGSRLQEAMWREALHMIAAGEATVEQIDASILDGPGLRWALTGPIMNFHLSGGPEGIAHVIDHFGPTLQEPWTRLSAPALTEELKQQVIHGCERESEGRSVEGLVEERDRGLIAIMRARRSVWAPKD